MSKNSRIHYRRIVDGINNRSQQQKTHHRNSETRSGRDAPITPAEDIERLCSKFEASHNFKYLKTAVQVAQRNNLLPPIIDRLNKAEQELHDNSVRAKVLRMTANIHKDSLNDRRQYLGYLFKSYAAEQNPSVALSVAKELIDNQDYTSANTFLKAAHNNDLTTGFKISVHQYSAELAQKLSETQPQEAAQHLDDFHTHLYQASTMLNERVNEIAPHILEKLKTHQEKLKAAEQNMTSYIEHG